MTKKKKKAKSGKDAARRGSVDRSPKQMDKKKSDRQDDTLRDLWTIHNSY